MPDQYIEIEWNGVRTRVPVMDYAEWVATIVFPPADPVFTQMWQPKPDADSEYDRDVRGE